MKMSEAFPSKYISAADVGSEPTVQIRTVEMEQIGQGSEPPKPVVYFERARKGMVLNKTNANAIAQLYGDETDNWRGKHITLFPVWTEFQGNQVRAVRIRPPDGGPQVNDPGHQAPTDPPATLSNGDPLGDNPLDDDIPF